MEVKRNLSNFLQTKFEIHRTYITSIIISRMQCIVAEENSGFVQEYKNRAIKGIKDKLKLTIKSRKLIPLKSNSFESCSSPEECEKTDHNTPPMESIKIIETDETEGFQDKYRILEKIGEGSNGIVYKCMKKKNRSMHAVKKMQCDIEHCYSTKEIFRAIRKMKHDNVIKYHSLYVNSGKRKAYIVMELFDFPQLAKVKISGESELRRIAHQLLDAVSNFHENGLCHRDIKPSNILYDQANQKIKVIDMGISKKIGVKKWKKDMLTCTGTLYYKAPEMMRGSEYSEIIDEWATGVTLYKLVTGKTPFESVYVSTTISNIEEGLLNFEDEAWKNYSFLCKDLIKRLISPRSSRLTAKEALEHLWFSGQARSTLWSSSRGKKKPINHKLSYDDMGFSSLTNSSTPIRPKQMKNRLLEKNQTDSEYCDSCDEEANETQI